MMQYDVEYTDTFAGEANYCWVRRARVNMPELTNYGYTGSPDGSYEKANRVYERELMRKAKKAMGITGVRGTRIDGGGMIEFRPHCRCTVMFIVPVY